MRGKSVRPQLCSIGRAMRGALKQSQLYSEELGIDLSQGTDQRTSAGFWQASCLVPGFRKQ
jgi:hypothetical protein